MKRKTDMNQTSVDRLYSIVRKCQRIIFNFIIIIAIIVWILPLLGILINSFRPYTDVNSAGWWTILTQPNFTFDNFLVALSDGYIFSGFKNSILITIPSVFFLILISLSTAYALIWTDLPGKKIIYMLATAMIIIPPEITLYPTLIILKQFNLLNTYLGIWMSHVSSALPFGIFLMGSFISEIPKELIEAAKIDGATTWNILFKIVNPLSRTAILSLATFDFLWVWNDLLRSIVIIPDPNLRPLTAVLANLSGAYGEYITVVAAGAILLMVPPLLVFLFGQKYFIRGVMAGAVK